MTVWIDIPGDPVPKGRPRFARVGAGVRSYTPAKTATYEQLVAMIARQAMRGREPMAGALQATLHVGLPIPKSWSKAKREAAAMGELWPTVKPDVDNVAKAALDACNGIVYIDDSQVVRLLVVKQFAIEPGVSVKIESVQDKA